MGDPFRVGSRVSFLTLYTKVLVPSVFSQLREVRDAPVTSFTKYPLRNIHFSLPRGHLSTTARWPSLWPSEPSSWIKTPSFQTSSLCST